LFESAFFNSLSETCAQAVSLTARAITYPRFGHSMKRRPKILIVEDDPLVRKTFARLMEEENYQVHCAENCRPALEELERERFDLVLTDIRLGDGDGIEVLECAKKTNPGGIVFMITGYASLDSMKKAMRKGAEDYIVKPIDMNLLMIKVKNVLERH